MFECYVIMLAHLSRFSPDTVLCCVTRCKRWQRKRWQRQERCQRCRVAPMLLWASTLIQNSRHATEQVVLNHQSSTCVCILHWCHTSLYLHNTFHTFRGEEGFTFWTETRPKTDTQVKRCEIRKWRISNSDKVRFRAGRATGTDVIYIHNYVNCMSISF